MTYFDSHAHLDSFDESGVLPGVIKRSRSAGVTHVIAIGGTLESNARAIRLAAAYPDVSATVGFDRDLAGQGVCFEELADQSAQPGVVAMGESGLDYHYAADTATEQRALFGGVLELAASRSLPVVVHSRDAEEDTLAMLKDMQTAWAKPSKPMGVLHCFTGSRPFAERLMEMGMMISFSGIVSFKKAEEIRDVARHIPDDRLLIETDAPYLAPVPYRGKENEPAYVVHVAEALAETRQQDLEHVAEVSYNNANRLFGLAGEQ